MVLDKLPVPGRPTIWMIVGQGPTALAVGAGGGCLDIFNLLYHFSPLSPSLWETTRYRLKYWLQGPLNPKHPTNGTLFQYEEFHRRWDSTMTSSAVSQRLSDVIVENQTWNGMLVVLDLTALCDSISVYIGPSPRDREKEERNDR